MTRDDHIYKQAAEYATELTKGLMTGKSCAKRNYLFSGFMKGAHWADENPHWISVEDKLPKNNECILGYCPAKERVLILFYSCNHFSCCADGEITHWMPLPAPPKKGGEK